MATNDTVIDAVIFRVEYSNTSASGNPTMRIHTDHGNFLTVIDGAVGYEVRNIESARPGTTDYVTDGKPCQITLTRNNRVRFIHRDGRRVGK